MLLHNRISTIAHNNEIIITVSLQTPLANTRSKACLVTLSISLTEPYRVTEPGGGIETDGMIEPYGVT